MVLANVPGVQSVLLPLTQKLPLGHVSEHTGAVSSVGEYSPSAHGCTVHCSREMDAGGDCGAELGHALHSLSSVAPVTSLYVLLGQGRHADERAKGA